MKNHRFSVHVLASLLANAFLVQGCEKIALTPIKENGHTANGNAADTVSLPDTLIAVNDTARFYLSGVEYSGITLAAYPIPSSLIADARYRLPTKLEVSDLLRKVSLPDGYWQSKQRILCYDTPEDADNKSGSAVFGTGYYYTYVPNGTIAKAGFKTEYCILPIRSERILGANTSTGIIVNDKWNGQHDYIFP